MTSFSLVRRKRDTRNHVTTRFGILLIASLLSTPLSFSVAVAQNTTPAPQAPAAGAQAASPQALEAWRKSMARVPTPKSGCYTAEYPKTEWVAAPCMTPPAQPYPPARGVVPEIVGNGNDYAAEAASLISSASGGFDSITNVTSETETYQGPNGPVTLSNWYSLQLNTNPFKTPTCAGTSYPSFCQGWQQFVFSNAGVIFTQYWLLSYGTCPNGWAPYGIDCWRNGPNGRYVPPQPLSNLKNIVLQGQASAGGQDAIIIDTGGGTMTGASNPDSALALAQGWTTAEFNIFGDCCNRRAVFNNGATMVIKTDVNNGTSNAPVCLPAGYTGETNSLTVAPPCCPVGGATPGILFTQSNATGAKSMCACPTNATWDTRTASCSCAIKGEAIIAGHCACPEGTFFHAGRCECAEPQSSKCTTGG